MSLIFKLLLVAIAVCLALTIGFVAGYFLNKAYGKGACDKKSEDVDEIQVDEKPEEQVPATEETAPAVVEEVAVSAPFEFTVKEKGISIGELEDEEDDREIATRIRTFAEKMLDIDVRTQEYYDTLNNEFLTYRKMHARISKKCASYRFGRKLIAKISIRGKTMKLHLSLDVTKFPENIYFQKDMSDVKSYVETPFTVKVKSDRGLKKALELVQALVTKEGVEKKTRYTAVDSMEEIRHIVTESNDDLNEDIDETLDAEE